MNTELEKTELEIAKLKLAQEKHKLEQLQKRQRVVDGLGQGAAAVGGVAKSGVRWVMWVVVGAVVGLLTSVIARLVIGLVFDGFSCPYPYTTLAENIGCFLGGIPPDEFVALAMVLSPVGAYIGHHVHVGYTRSTG